MNASQINRILKKNKTLPLIAIWKAIIVNEGVDSCLNKKYFGKNLANYKIKYAVKTPLSANYEVLDRSNDERVIPSEVIISDDSGNQSLLKLRYNPKSVIGLSVSSKQKNIRFYINDGKKKIIIPMEVSFVKETGDSVVNIVGADRLSVNIFDGCWNWNIGSQCKFCDLSPKRKSYNSVVPSLNDLVLCSFDYKLWWDKSKRLYFKELKKSFKKMYKIAYPHKHLLIMSGGFINNDFLWEIIIELIGAMNKTIPLNNLDNYINVPPPTKNIKANFLKLKKLGIKQIQINLEVATKKKFVEICPGKSSSIGYDNYKKALDIAVDVFGFGNVRSNFVFTAHSSTELLIEAKKIAKSGIVMDYSIFQPKKGTPWSKKKGPSVDEILSFSKSLAEIYRKYKFKGIYCNLSSRSGIMNELLNG